MFLLIRSSFFCHQNKEWGVTISTEAAETYTRAHTHAHTHTYTHTYTHIPSPQVDITVSDIARWDKLLFVIEPT